MGSIADAVKHWSDCCAGLLRDTRDVLREIDDDCFRTPYLEVQASIGTHVRHLAGAVESLLSGASAGEIDYDRRTRDDRLECSRQTTMEHLQRLATRLESEIAGQPDTQLRVWCDEPRGPRAPGAPSSLVRELRFLASHTVHHQAMIATILRSHEMDVPSSFGIARSTLLHQARGDE